MELPSHDSADCLATVTSANTTEHPPAKTQDEVFIVSNPLAGAKSASRLIQDLASQLQQRGLKTKNLHDLEIISQTVEKSLLDGRLKAVVCAGGDGTAAAVVNRTPPETPLVLLPSGTENLLAKHIGQPFDAAGVCQMLCQGDFVQFDVGRAGDRLFLLMLSAGFDAEVVRQLAESRTGHITHWSWAKPIWNSLRSYQYPEMRIHWQSSREKGKLAQAAEIAAVESKVPLVPEDSPQPKKSETSVVESAKQNFESEAEETVTLARWAFISNLPCYARGIPIVPNADGTDSHLDMCTFDGSSFAGGMRLLIHTVLRRQHRLRNCQQVRTRKLRLEADQPVPYQVDGDPGGWLPVDVEIIPQRMRLIVPSEFAAQINKL